MAEKKNGEYEKPESQKVGGDDLEDVSGGAGSGNPSLCRDGGDANVNCLSGPSPTGLCQSGGSAYKGGGCQSGSQPGSAGCKTGSAFH